MRPNRRAISRGLEHNPVVRPTYMTKFSAQRKKRPMASRGNYILIAMPNVTRATAFRAAIDVAEHETVLARDGQEAQQEIAKRGQPLLLILDLSLPKVDGFELLTQLGRPPGHPRPRSWSYRVTRRCGPRRAEWLSLLISRGSCRPTSTGSALREAIDAALNELNPQRRQARLSPRWLHRRPPPTRRSRSKM